MRADMAKVIVERPRRKGWETRKPKGYRRRLRRYGDDGPPAREGMTTCWEGGSKSLNEHLGPLRRYLDRQVGRPWNKVFSEICAHINRNSAVQDHVRDHVADYVTIHVVLRDGVPFSQEGTWRLGRAVQPGYWYVCPRTGLLRKVKPAARRPKPKKIQRPAFIRVGDSVQCRFIDGAWHVVYLDPLPVPSWNRERCVDRDILLDRLVCQITDAEAKRQYGRPVYAVGKRRLARRELKQYPIPAKFWE
jgi:hypothetical protein